MKTKGPRALAWERFKRHRFAATWGKVLAGLYLLVILADPIAPYGPHGAVDRKPYHPPNARFVDGAGRFHIRPFVYGSRFEFDGEHRRTYREDTTARYPISILVRGEPYRFLGIIEWNVHLFGIRGIDRDDPNRPMMYILGSDYRGRDILSRILHGGRISLSVGLIGVFISFTIGLLVGGISGYAGGWIDTAIMRLTEVIMTLPGLYILLAIRTAMPDTEGWSSARIFIAVVVILAFIYWAGLARVIRGMVLSIKEREYVVAARAMGRSPLSIIVRHIIPGTLSYAIVAATVSIPGYILMESALSMLGLGIQEPDASWGNMLADATKISHIENHPWILAPGLFISLSVMAFNFVGDGLRDALDPDAGR